MDPRARYPPKPSRYALTTVGIIIVEAVWFLVIIPYNTVPDKLTFWISFAAWAVPPITIEWMYVNTPTKREMNAYTNMTIGIGLLAIVFGVAAGSVSLLVPIAMALVPGVLAGGLIGGDTTLIWKLRNWK